jgi:hypothetical protein
MIKKIIDELWKTESHNLRHNQAGKSDFYSVNC